MQPLFSIISLLIVGAIVLFFYRAYKKKTPDILPAPEMEKQILQRDVKFYQGLSASEKERFEKAMQAFLESIKITGVKTEVSDQDRVFIAAAAIIPIFGFNNWQYYNIHEILLYPDSFTEDYHIDGEGRNILGMVGNGPMQNVMIISRSELRNGFLNNSDRSNTAIHEFVHLVDKSDGDADGVPAILFDHPYSVPWLQRIHAEIQLIKTNASDINVYGATNEAEFLAVAAEYFFKQPERMQKKHPELFSMLQQVFKPVDRK